ncbi:MAG: SsrA-binding protein SmpB [Ilumatobacter sp.]|nr:SsrA-binding protein SmpB [Ilumatobacter sp.]
MVYLLVRIGDVDPTERRLAALGQGFGRGTRSSARAFRRCHPDHAGRRLGSLPSVAKKSTKRKGAPEGTTLIASNRAARRNYSITDTFEAGIVLLGSEVKSMREAQVQIADGYVRFRDGEAWLEGVHVAPYSMAIGFGAHDPDRSRKLLLHRAEIDRLKARVDQERVSLIPLTLYFRDGRAKVEVGIGKGRSKEDKRHAIAERDALRDAEREMVRARKYQSND